jgi:hypothetical protein
MEVFLGPAGEWILPIEPVEDEDAHSATQRVR